MSATERHKGESGNTAVLSIVRSSPSIEELERRLETAFLGTGFPLAEAGLPTRLGQQGEDTCGCLGTLCQCDGAHCVAVCDARCVVHYL